jgi:hypothetical protein
LVAGTGPYWRVEIVTADNKKVFHSTPKGRHLESRWKIGSPECRLAKGG